MWDTAQRLPTGTPSLDASLGRLDNGTLSTRMVFLSNSSYMCLEEAVSPISHVDLLALLYLTITGGSST